MRDRVLLIEDDDAMRASLTQSLELEDMIVVQANGLAQARRTIRANFAGIVLSDIRMPHADGFDVLERVRAIDHDLPVIFLTGEADVPTAVRALQNGVYDFLEKPCSVDTLVNTVRRALKHRQIVLQARRLETMLEHSDAAAIHFPGNTTASQVLRRELRRLSEIDVDVHFVGDPGVGKRLAAHTIHFQSDNSASAVSINFARDGAVRVHEEPEAWANRVVIAKNIERADAADVLRLLQKLEQSSDARLLTTSVKQLDDITHWQKMRQARPASVTVNVPNLRARAADLPVIFESLLRQVARNFDTDMPEAPANVLEEVGARDWSGNLPELRKLAQDVVLQGGESQRGLAIHGFNEQVQAFEKTLLIEALKSNTGQAARAAEQLGLPRKTFYDKLAKYGIEPKSMKN